MKFDGEDYFDDRMFLLHICRGTVEFQKEKVFTTIYHENPPSNTTWCLVTYRNCAPYPLVSVDHFDSEEAAAAYMRQVEPLTPLVSCGGASPAPPYSYESYVEWKARKGLVGYDYKRAFQSDAPNPREIFWQTKSMYYERQRNLKVRMSQQAG